MTCLVDDGLYIVAIASNVVICLRVSIAVHIEASFDVDAVVGACLRPRCLLMTLLVAYSLISCF